MTEWLKFLRITGNRVWGTQWWRQILHRKWKYGCSCMCNEKYAI